MDGCSRDGRRWERLHDDLVERTADPARLAHHDQVEPAGLDGFLTARQQTRDDVSRRGGALDYTTVASPLLGGADAEGMA